MSIAKEQVFPDFEKQWYYDLERWSGHFEAVGGLTKREYFAGLALVGMTRCYENPGLAATNAVKYADTLLAELAKGEG